MYGFSIFFARATLWGKFKKNHWKIPIRGSRKFQGRMRSVPRDKEASRLSKWRFKEVLGVFKECLKCFLGNFN